MKIIWGIRCRSFSTFYLLIAADRCYSPGACLFNCVSFMMLPLKFFCHVSNFFSNSLSFWVCFILWISLSRWHIAIWEVQTSAHSIMSYCFNVSFFHFVVLLFNGYNTQQCERAAKQKALSGRGLVFFLKKQGKWYTFVGFFEYLILAVNQVVIKYSQTRWSFLQSCQQSKCHSALHCFCSFLFKILYISWDWTYTL